VQRQGAQVSASELIEHMRPKVAKWWLPDAVEFLDKFPMTGTGKIHKLTLRQQFKDYRLPDAGEQERRAS
jgi:fatty-acyl-CoA synthase